MYFILLFSNLECHFPKNIQGSYIHMPEIWKGLTHSGTRAKILKHCYLICVKT